MVRTYLKTAMLTVIGFLLTIPVVSMNWAIPDDEMPDNYKGIIIEEVEEEPSTNPHRSLLPEIFAYYYCKSIHIETDVPIANLTIEIINTNNGKIKIEDIIVNGSMTSVDISGMGVGSYIVHIIINNGLRRIGYFELHN